MSRIADAFEGGPALVTYVVAGDPGRSDGPVDPDDAAEATKEHVRALVRGGADIVELGLPFSEPIADGPTIQGAITRALDAGMTPSRFFELVSELDVDAPLVVMTYYNLLHRYGGGEGVEAFVAAAADAGIDGIIVPDLPVEESGPLRAACDREGIDLIFIVAPTTRGDRLDRIMGQVSGFVYVQARLGTTGARADVSGQTHEALSRLSGYEVPKAVGFGVSRGEHAAEIVRAGADGVVVGSALVDIVADDGPDAVDRLEAKVRELAEGTRVDRPEPEGT